MCLILFAWKSVPGSRLIVAANRDEWFGRPAHRADFWQDQPSILAGRDDQAGGTWLGVTRAGRFAIRSINVPMPRQGGNLLLHSFPEVALRKRSLIPCTPVHRPITGSVCWPVMGSGYSVIQIAPTM